MKKLIYVCLILTFCVMPLVGCDQPSPTPTPPPSDDTAVVPMDIDIDGGFCDVKVKTDPDANGKQDFEMSVTCGRTEYFHIIVDGSNPNGGGADGVDVDIMGRDFLNWGTLR
jgi:hypothetical protein